MQTPRDRVPVTGVFFLDSHVTKSLPHTVVLDFLFQRMWLADFQQHMQEGDATDDRDGKMMKSLVESIIIWPDRMEIHFKCGVNIEQKYVK